MKIEGLERVISALRAKAAKSRKDSQASVLVGYTAAYALYVHESMEPKHLGEPRPSGLGKFWGPSLYGPKFLEGPARQFRGELAKIARTALQAGRTMAEALLLAGLRLQRESQKRVPVEYGNLRASAFTRLET